MESTQSAQSRERLSYSTLFNYNFPAVGVGFMFFLVLLYLMKFSTDVLLIPPAAMGFIFGLSRIWDAITDPVAGYLSDRTTLAAGRRKPWILGAIPFICCAFYMMWNPDASLSPTGNLIWVGIGVVLFYTAITAFVVPHVSLGAELSTSYHERNRVFGFRHAAWTSGALLALIALYQLIVASEPRVAAFYVSLTACLVTAAMLLWLFFTIKERSEYQGKGERNVLTAFGDVLRNPHALVVLGAYFIENIGGATIGVLTPYIAQYIVGTPELTPLYILAYLIPSAFSVPFWLPVIRRLGKKNVWILSLIVSGLGFGAMFFLEQGDEILYAVLAAICGFSACAGAVAAPSIQADIIDYDEYRTGKRKEGTYFATWNFVFKTATGFTLMLTGFVLGLSGFTPNVEQTDTTKLALLTLYAIFPLVCYLAGALMFTLFRFSEADHAKIRASLDRNEYEFSQQEEK